MRDYMTQDLGKAAAMVLALKRQPDEYQRLDGQRPQVIFLFKNVDEEVARKLSGRLMLVEPLSFTEVYRQLKNQILKIIDGESNEHNGIN